RRVVVEAHPRRRHRVGVDVVEQLVGSEIAHLQRQRSCELLTDAIGILGEIEDALAGGERETSVRHRGAPYHRDGVWGQLRPVTEMTRCAIRAPGTALASTEPEPCPFAAAGAVPSRGPTWDGMTGRP